jgi:uncharacterized LabA/DUF88 family protein
LHRAVVVIDYQNMHLTARGAFTPQGTPTHHSLLHPLHLANQILIARKVALGANYQETALERVEVFRGLPSNQHDPKGYSRSQAQRAEWTRDSRVAVTYRPLRYQHEQGNLVPREKGVDVLVALKLVELAQSGAYDLVILAAHDTDLEPALEVALASEPCRTRKVRVETAGWQNCKNLQPSGGPRIWHTSMLPVNYQAARDRKIY